MRRKDSVMGVGGKWCGVLLRHFFGCRKTRTLSPGLAKIVVMGIFFVVDQFSGCHGGNVTCWFVTNDPDGLGGLGFAPTQIIPPN